MPEAFMNRPHALPLIGWPFLAGKDVLGIGIECSSFAEDHARGYGERHRVFAVHLGSGCRDGPDMALDYAGGMLASDR